MKIAISGAGIAGSCLAYWLHRTGHEPTLIEQAPQLRDGGYIIDFWGVGYRVAEKMGIESALLDAGYNVREVRLVDSRGRTAARLDTQGIRRRVGGFTSLARGDLARIIYSACAPGVETVFGDTIAAIEPRGDGVRVGFERGPERDFDLVIGADGLRSKVRALVFGPEERFEKRLGYRVAAFEAAGYRPREEGVYVIHGTPGRQASRFSLKEDRTLFLLVWRAELAADGAPPDPVFADAGWECPRILDLLHRSGDVYLDEVSQMRMETWSKGRVMLIGDAAACVSLLAGEGTGLAMTEAYVLAGELTRAGGDYRQAFERCERRLRPFIEGKQHAAQRFAATFAPRTALGLWARRQALKLMRFGPLLDLFVRRTLHDDLTLPEYGM